MRRRAERKKGRFRIRKDSKRHKEGEEGVERGRRRSGEKEVERIEGKEEV